MSIRTFVCICTFDCEAHNKPFLSTLSTWLHVNILLDINLNDEFGLLLCAIRADVLWYYRYIHTTLCICTCRAQKTVT